MRRLALLIGQNASVHGYLHGVEPDVRRMRAFLQSDHGGAWEAHEVHHLPAPKAADLACLLGSLGGKVDFLFIAFSGHGEVVNGQTVVAINDFENFSVLHLAASSVLHQLILLDSCRVEEMVVLTEKRAHVATLGGIPRVNPQYRPSCRALYESAIARAGAGVTRMFSCNLGETAADTNNGGVFSFSLVSHAVDWAETHGNGSHAAAILSVPAVFAAAAHSTTTFNPPQHPELNDTRRRHPFPFAVALRAFSESPMTRRGSSSLLGKTKRFTEATNAWAFHPHILIYSSDEKFIVGLDAELDVDWETTDSFDASRGTNARRDSEIQNRVAVLEGYPLDDLGESVQVAFRRMVGEALARAFQNQHDSAEDILREADSYYKTQWSDARSRAAELSAKYDAYRTRWSTASFFLRVVQVLLGIVGIVCQVAATAANLGAVIGIAPALLSLLATAALGILYAFSIGSKADRYRAASRMLDVALDRFRSGDLSRAGLIGVFERAEHHIGSVVFLPHRQTPPQAGPGHLEE